MRGRQQTLRPQGDGGASLAPFNHEEK